MVQVLKEKGKVTGWKTTCCKCGESVTFTKKNEGPWGVNETPTTPDEYAQCGPCWREKK